MERGRLLVSTRSNATGRKRVLLLCCIISYLFGIFFLMNFDAFSSMGYDLFDNRLIGNLIGFSLTFGLPAYTTFSFLVSRASSKSYCDVYEHAVVGTTGISAANPNAPMQDFELSYSQIRNITKSKKMIILYTNYGEYHVLALQNCDAAISAIRARLHPQIHS